jgi:hypothetical protein
MEMNGGDWEENIRILGRENKLLQEANPRMKGGEKVAKNANTNQ